MTANLRVPRVGLAGCGAVSRLYYAPALARLGVEGVLRFVAAFDPDLSAARELASTAPDATAHGDYDDLLTRDLDLVIVASPPAHHAAQAIAALGRGIAVHCEKPLAPDPDSADAMASAATASGRPLFAAMVRRHLPATRMIKGLLASGAMGSLRSIDIFEGGPFDWPVSSPHYFAPEAGNDVLSDIGTHCIDLVCWWLGEPDSIRYWDDALGGTAANCLIEMDFGQCRCRIRISRDWARPNQLLVQASNGWIRWEPNEAQRIDFGIHETGLGAALNLRKVKAGAGAPVLSSPAEDFAGAFESQLRESISGLTGPSSAVPIGDVLPTIRIINMCRLGRQSMNQPWLAGEGV